MRGRAALTGGPAQIPSERNYRTGLLLGSGGERTLGMMQVRTGGSNVDVSFIFVQVSRRPRWLRRRSDRSQCRVELGLLNCRIADQLPGTAVVVEVS